MMREDLAAYKYHHVRSLGGLVVMGPMLRFQAIWRVRFPIMVPSALAAAFSAAFTHGCLAVPSGALPVLTCEDALEAILDCMGLYVFVRVGDTPE